MANSISSRDALSSARSSHSPPVVEQAAEEPRKKGARGGKRSVTHLSKAQLARKRANDREAQRNIRQRTKEHIENLEQKVKELERGGRSSSVERIIRRNEELEAEVEKLRAQVAQTQVGQHSNVHSPTHSSHMPDDLLMPRKTALEWLPEQEQLPHQWSTGNLANHNPSMSSNESPDAPFTMDDQMYSPEAQKFEESDDPQQQYVPTAIPIWNDPMALGDGSQAFAKSNSLAWAPFHPALSQPSRFADLQASGFSDVISTPNYTSTNCWQSQPSIYAWQISTKLKAPITLVDQLMFSVINSQRHLHITDNLNNEALTGPAFPSVNMLFNQPSAKPPSSLTEVMARYSAVLSNRGFALIPEKLASFMCMYRFIQWQISPTYQTYKALHDWQAPQPSQLTVAHPAWMDLPPWPKFREKVINNQDRYDNDEFQSLYASNLSVNFNYDPMKALVFVDGQIMVSQMMDTHLSDLANMSMKRPFAEKYPEFRDVCRFDEIE